MEIRSLSDIGFDVLYTAWTDAFSNYTRTWSRTEFENMLLRRGYIPGLSFGAYDGNELAGFTLNGIGIFNGQQTAYDTGTGTTQAYRGKKLAGQIFEYSLPLLKDAGCTQYLLEVLQDNKAAIAVYNNMGFGVTRELNYFIGDINNIKFDARILPPAFQLAEIDLSLQKEMEMMWDFEPSWQNNFASVSRQLNRFRAIGVFENDKFIGYGIIEPTSGDIPQLAISWPYRRKGLGSIILKKLVEYNQSPAIKAINTDAANTAITSFLECSGIPLKGSQYEMMRNIQ